MGKMAKRISGYSGLQIGLHWLIAILVIAAYFTSEGMGDALEARVAAGRTGIDGNTIHVWLGGSVFALTILRIIVRRIKGAPPSPEGTSTFMELAAKWGHRLIYALLILVPMGGAVTWYGGVEAAGDGHEIFGNLFMIVVLGHALIAIAHAILWRDGTLKRMIQPQN